MSHCGVILTKDNKPLIEVLFNKIIESHEKLNLDNCLKMELEISKSDVGSNL